MTSKRTTTIAAYRTSPPRLRRIASHDGKTMMETLERVLADALAARGLPIEIPVADELAKDCEGLMPGCETFPVCKLCGCQAADEIPPGWILCMGKTDGSAEHWECSECTPGRRGVTCLNCGGRLTDGGDRFPKKRFCALCNTWYDFKNGKLKQDGTPVSPIKGWPYYPIRMMEFLPCKTP